MGGPGREPILTEELAAFLQSGLSICIATRDAELTPNGTRTWAVTVDDDRVHVTAFLYARTAGSILLDLRSHPEVALGFDRPADSRACQIKGTFLGSRRCGAADRGEIERQVEEFLANLRTIGLPSELFSGWTAWPAIAVRIRVTDVFHQTPGPGAGERMP